MVEAPFTLLDEQVEVVLGDAVVASEMSLGLVPEVLDAVDVVCIVGEQLRMIDADMVELRDIQHVIGAEGIGVDDGVGPHFVQDDGKKSVGAGIWDDDDVNPAAPLQEPEHRNLAGRAAPTLTLPVPAEIAFVCLDLAADETGFASRQLFEDHFPELVEEQDGGVAVDPGQFGRRAGRGARTEILKELDLNTFREPAASPSANHLT